MLDTVVCPKCGKALPGDAPSGICPHCLLLAGLDSDLDVPAEKWSPFAATTPQTARFAPPPAATLAPLFPQLEIIELLGHGGMGAVYKARQTKLDRLVALKVIRPESAADPAFAERFNREARTLARLSHPNIVGVHDFGEVSVPGEQGAAARTLYYFVMEYIDGVNLRELIQSGELQPVQTLTIVPQICEALQFAHDEGVIHRDIKPENILLDRRGRVKIADFGLAKLAVGSDQDFTLTGTHQIMGTPRYMAPEQMEGSHGVDQRADIYSLGVVFYEMLTGHVPAGHFEPPSRKVGVDARLDEVILKALARDPGQRFQWASELKSRVEAISLPSSSMVSAASATAWHSGSRSSAGLTTIVDRQFVGAWRWMTGDVPTAVSEPQGMPQFPGLLLIVLSVLGCLSVLGPWFELRFADGTDVDGSRLAEPVVVTLYGHAMHPMGMFVMVAFAALALLVLVTSISRPPGKWRAALQFLMSVAAVASAFSVKWNADGGVVSLPVLLAGSTMQASEYRHRTTIAVRSVEHETSYGWGFATAMVCSLSTLVLSASGVRHAFAPSQTGEPVPPSAGTTTPPLLKVRSQGAPITDYRFSVDESCNVFRQARFHFGSLGYEVTHQDADEIVFERGYTWAGALETDIRRFKTWLTVRVSPPEAGRRHVGCHWSVRTMGALIRRRDTETLKSEGEQFQEYLASQSADGDFVGTEVARTGLPAANAVVGHGPEVPTSARRDSANREPCDLVQMRADVDGPSLVMMVCGLLMVVGHLIAVQILLDQPRESEMFLFALPGVVTGLGMFAGGLSLRYLWSYGWAQVGVFLGFIPTGPGWLISLLVSIWIWNLMDRPDIRRAFLEVARQRHHAAGMTR